MTAVNVLNHRVCCSLCVTLREAVDHANCLGVLVGPDIHPSLVDQAPGQDAHENNEGVWVHHSEVCHNVLDPADSTCLGYSHDTCGHSQAHWGTVRGLLMPDGALCEVIDRANGLTALSNNVNCQDDSAQSSHWQGQ